MRVSKIMVLMMNFVYYVFVVWGNVVLVEYRNFKEDLVDVVVECLEKVLLFYNWFMYIIK